MNNICFLFSGQGSQYPGMGRELTEQFPELEKIYDTGSEILGFDLKQACWNFPAEELAKTETAQPAILAASLIAFGAVQKLGISPAMVAGHSLGEYAAMAASGMLSLEDAFRVIKARAAAMGRCAEGQDGSMAAVMGLPPEEIAQVCEETEGFVLPVNFNSPVQTVIAGESGAVAAAMEKFAEMGKKSVKLAVSAAFHSKLMQPAAEEFRAAIQDIPFQAPKLDFYSNLTGEKLTDFSDMPGYLAEHLVSPVQFVRELQAIHSAGADGFVECGPNKVLTGLVKKTLSGIPAFNVENAKTYAKLAEACGKES